MSMRVLASIAINPATGGTLQGTFGGSVVTIVTAGAQWGILLQTDQGGDRAFVDPNDCHVEVTVQGPLATALQPRIVARGAGESLRVAIVGADGVTPTAGADIVRVVVARAAPGGT